MYIPSTYRETDLSIAYDLLEDIRLGTLISASGRIQASHLPFLVDRDIGELGRLVGHCARANPQWQQLKDGDEVLLAFLGPNTHVSPSWYASHPRAPTWLYAAVHVRGRITLLHDKQTLREIVWRFSDDLEPPDSTWSIHSTGDYVDRLLPGIVGFHIEIADIQTQLRLAQQNTMEDRNRVYEALNAGSLRTQQVAQLVHRFAIAEQKTDEGRLRGSE